LKLPLLKTLNLFISGVVLVSGCATTASNRLGHTSDRGKRGFVRVVHDDGGTPILKIVCKYIGKKPVKGFQAGTSGNTADSNLYNLSFKNLTDKRIEFISRKVYQSFPGETKNAGNSPAKKSSILIESSDYRKVYDPRFDHLEYREERTLINWPVQTSNLHPDAITSMIFRIRYMEREYRFNILLAYGI
jgi:hypothetical protein